jgi:hypothetical protein
MKKRENLTLKKTTISKFIVSEKLKKGECSRVISGDTTVGGGR